MKRIYACILIVAALLAVSLYRTAPLRQYGRKIFPLHGRHLPRVQSCATPCGRL